MAALGSHGEANEEVAWQGLWAIQQLAAVPAEDSLSLSQLSGIEACPGAVVWRGSRIEPKHISSRLQPELSGHSTRFLIH